MAVCWTLFGEGGLGSVGILSEVRVPSLVSLAALGGRCTEGNEHLPS